MSCKNTGLLFRNFANPQSTYKYFSQNPVSDLISFHALTVSSMSKFVRLVSFKTFEEMLVRNV